MGFLMGVRSFLCCAWNKSIQLLADFDVAGRALVLAVAISALIKKKNVKADKAKKMAALSTEEPDDKKKSETVAAKA